MCDPWWAGLGGTVGEHHCGVVACNVSMNGFIVINVGSMGPSKKSNWGY